MFGGSGDRRHYDSSSESSDGQGQGDGNGNGDRDRAAGSSFFAGKGGRRDGPPRRFGSGGGDDEQFSRYEDDRLRRERDSIQPLDMNPLAPAGPARGPGGGPGGLGMGMGMGMGMGGSVRDKASERDLLRADAAPVAVDPKLGFQVPYFGPLCRPLSRLLSEPPSNSYRAFLF